jgi:Protein of unknown function (DUF3098)
MAVKAKKTVTQDHEDLEWPFGRKNYIAFGIAVAVIAIGYLCLAFGTDQAPPDPTQESFVSITLAPLLLVIGYCVLIPVSLLIKDKGKAKSRSAEPDAAVES